LHRFQISKAANILITEETLIETMLKKLKNEAPVDMLLGKI